MELQGVQIPEEQRENFKNKPVVYLNDPLFQEAFIKIYAAHCFKSKEFEFKANDTFNSLKVEFIGR
jgi:hypothetical protein